MIILTYVFPVVPIHSIATSPNGSLQGVMVGSNHTIQCMISTTSGVFLNSVMVTWIGLTGLPLTNGSRITINPLMLSSDNSTVNITSSLQLMNLMEGDQGSFVCDVLILQTNISIAVEIGRFIGKYVYSPALHARYL